MLIFKVEHLENGSADFNEFWSHFKDFERPVRRNQLLLDSQFSVKATKYNHTDERQISEFIAKQDLHQKAMLHLQCLPLPFDLATVTMITQFIVATVGNIYKLRAERLHELEAPGY